MSVYITPTEYEKAESIGIPAKTVNHRVRQLNWSVRRAITTPMRIKSEFNIAMAISNGISERTFNARIYIHGWDRERAATVPPRPRRVKNSDGQLEY